ncbi:PAS domain S-box protein [bacterium]|nr:PAS domain S-box protein [candidate division CSSED10-310 bacterium]
MTGKPLSLLLIEDDRIDQMAFERFVRSGDFPCEYTIAGSITQAKTLLAKHRFDVVISDYNLADGTAFDIFDLLNQAPLIIATGTGNEIIAAQAMRRGAADYLMKDPDRNYLAVLPMTVENALRQRAAEEQIELLSHAIRSVSDSVVITDMAGMITYVNKAFLDSYQYGEPEVLGRNHEEICGGSCRDGDFYHTRKNGETFPVSLAHSIVRNEAGAAIAKVSVAHDITERKQAEEELRRARDELEVRVRERTVELYEANLQLKEEIAVRQQAEIDLRRERDKAQMYLDVAGVVMIVVNKDERILLINRKGCEILGLSEKEIIGKNWFDDFLPPSVRLVQRSGFNRLLTGVAERSSVESLVRTASGEERIISWHHTLLTDEKGNALGSLSSGEDITMRKHTEEALRRSEEQLRQAQKMEAIGELAGGIAHDFNNLMTIVSGYSQLLLIDMQPSDPLYESIEEIHKAGERAARLTRQLLAFSSRQMLQPRIVNINHVVADIEKMLNRLIGEDIKLVNRLEKRLAKVKADPGQIEQVLMNLVVNARDAMPEGGEITLQTSSTTFGTEEVKLNPRARPGAFVCISVQDEGTGMSRELLARIFDPFFTTKAAGKGTGLGLSVVYGIVKQHDGWIDVYSEPGQGSTFKIYLPAISVDEAPDGISDQSLEAFRGLGERILVVEDESGVRRFAVRTLQDNGYEVFEAANANDAMELFVKERGAFDLVFSDTVLPDRNGLQLVDQMRSMEPNMAVLLSSGYADRRSQWTAIQEKGFHFLQKPYTIPDLVRTVHEILTGE